MSTTILERPDAGVITTTHDETQQGNSEMAHIVKTKPGESAVAKVTEARIYGYPVEALCGYTWVPSKDPKKLPLCSTCEEIYELHRMMNEDLNSIDGMNY